LLDLRLSAGVDSDKEAFKKHNFQAYRVCFNEQATTVKLKKKITVSRSQSRNKLCQTYSMVNSICLWVSFFVVITILALLIIAEPQRPNYRNCYLTIEPSGLIKIGQKHSSNQAPREKDECIFRADVVKDGWDYVVIAFTIGTTTALVWIGWLTKKVNETAATAAEQSAKIASRQTDLIFQNERAWIVVKPQRPESWPLPNKGDIVFPLIFNFLWSAANVGRTPAFVNKLTVSTRIRERPVANEAITYDEGVELDGFVIPPGGDHTERYSIIMSEAQYDDIIQGQQCIAFYGHIHYEDTLETKEHITQFCAYWYYDLGLSLFMPIGPTGWNKYT
jgi:hypothetical protein